MHQGHHLDLRLVRNQWLLIDSKIEFLMSQANEEKTSGDFREMGQRLAQEVVAFVKKKMDKVSRSGHLRDIKLSFAGHSIGNVIIRSALSGTTNFALGVSHVSIWAVLSLRCIHDESLWVFLCRGCHGALSKIPLHLCFRIWSTLGLSLQFKLFI